MPESTSGYCKYCRGLPARFLNWLKTISISPSSLKPISCQVLPSFFIRILLSRSARFSRIRFVTRSSCSRRVTLASMRGLAAHSNPFAAISRPNSKYFSKCAEVKN